MSQLEAAGIVGPQDGKSKNREVLVSTFDELDVILKSYLK
jgi:DNA segregation ATPase FtsK/SpoIIIE-like protein